MHHQVTPTTDDIRILLVRYTALLLHRQLLQNQIASDRAEMARVKEETQEFIKSRDEARKLVKAQTEETRRLEAETQELRMEITRLSNEASGSDSIEAVNEAASPGDGQLE